MRSLRRKRSQVVLSVVVTTLGLAAMNVRAQDAVATCPSNFKVLAEDDTTRVLHFTQKKGETCGMHSHPYLVGYTLKSGGTLSCFTGWDQGARQPCQGRQRITAWAGNPFTRSTGSRRGSDCGRTQEVSHKANHTRDRADCNVAMLSPAFICILRMWLAFDSRADWMRRKLINDSESLM